MNDKIVRRAYINEIEVPLRSDIGYDQGLLRLHLRGYPHDGFCKGYANEYHGIKPDESIDGLVMIKLDDIPETFKIGRIVKVTIELEEE